MARFVQHRWLLFAGALGAMLFYHWLTFVPSPSIPEQRIHGSDKSVLEPVKKPLKLTGLGSAYGSWQFDPDPLSEDSIVYSVGLGEDTSWDEGMMAKYGMHIWGFDPTPKSVAYVRGNPKLGSKFHFTQEGLSTEQASKTFTKPKNPNHVSMREGEHQGLGEKVVVKVNTLRNWMRKNGHEYLDILKIDIEGSEYPVLEALLADDDLPFDQLLVEWHYRWHKDRSRHARVLQLLQSKGFVIAHSKSDGQEMTLIRQPYRASKYPRKHVHENKVVLESIGTNYGGWAFNAATVSKSTIVYSVGLGEDTSWDEGISQKYGLHVWGFDPTPKSIAYVAKNKKLGPTFHFTPEGLSTEVGTKVFTLPKNPNYVSMREGQHSNMGEKISVKVNTLRNWMERFGHQHIDILKIDIEGSEYSVLEDMLARDDLPFDQLLVEWHYRWLKNRGRHKAVLEALKAKGFIVIDSQSQGQVMSLYRPRRS